MPFPRLTLLLIAYMAWPEDRAVRDKWMASHLAQFISASGASLSADIGLQNLEAFEMFGGLSALADAAQDKLLDQLVRNQSRWVHVADILQFVVDIEYDDRLHIQGGPSISKALDLTQRYDSSPTKTVFETSWRAYRHVAHLLAAAAWLSCESHKDAECQTGSLLTAALLAPEAVISLAASYQQFGLSMLSHGVRQPVLDPAHLWRVPIRPEFLPLPFRRLADVNLAYLSAERRARRKSK